MGGDLREKRPDCGEGGRRGHNQAGIQECRSLGGADVVGDLRFVSEKMEAQEGKGLARGHRAWGRPSLSPAGTAAPAGAIVSPAWRPELTGES